MSEFLNFHDVPVSTLDELVRSGDIELGRGNIISKIDIRADTGLYPIYSSSAKNNGMMGKYGKFMFDEELVTWSVDGGGKFFYRPKHKFSVTNVSGYMRANHEKFDYKFLHGVLDYQHLFLNFDYQSKAHPSVIRELYDIPIPPLPEQKKIASILTSVDEVIENTQKQIDKLQDLKKATMNELLTKGIGHTEFKDSELGRIPKSWEVQSLLEVATNGISNGVFNDPKKQGGDYRLINVYDMYQGFGVDIQKLSRLELSEKEFLNNRVEYGDIFLTRSSLKLEGIAHCNICLNDSENLTYDGHLMKITPNKSLVEPIYLALQCLSDAGRLFLMRMAKQSTMTTIGQQDIAPLPIPLPSLEEQRQIIGIHESFEVRLKRLKTKLSQTQSLKKSLMQDLLTGRVRVNL